MDKSKSKWVNLTPHTIRMADSDGQIVLKVPPSGEVARVTWRRNKRERIITGIPVPVIPVAKADSIVGLPGFEEEGTFFLVSRLVLDNCERRDTFAPDTGEESVIRDLEGQPYAVKRLLCCRR